MKFEIPEDFELGGVTHHVEIVPSIETSQDLGIFDPIRKRIKIAQTSMMREIPLGSREQTFCHELVHAILNMMRKDDLYDDESFVNTFAAFLHEAIVTMECR